MSAPAMQARTVVRWIVTGLLAALMTLSAVPDVLRVPGALAVFAHLGYPPYLLPFLGTAKLLAVAVVLVPGVRTLKEWAFAGLTFDLTGALYSHLSTGDGPGMWAPAAAGLVLLSGSYVAYRLWTTAEWTSAQQSELVTPGSAGVIHSSHVADRA